MTRAGSRLCHPKIYELRPKTFPSHLPLRPSSPAGIYSSPLLRLADSSHIGIAFVFAERQAHVDESAYRGAGLAVRQDGLDVS